MGAWARTCEIPGLRHEMTSQLRLWHTHKKIMPFWQWRCQHFIYQVIHWTTNWKCLCAWGKSSLFLLTYHVYEVSLSMHSAMTPPPAWLVLIKTTSVLAFDPLFHYKHWIIPEYLQLRFFSLSSFSSMYHIAGWETDTHCSGFGNSSVDVHICWCAHRLNYCE